MSLYERIFFAQGECAEEYLDYYREHGPEALLDYLLNVAHYPGEHDVVSQDGPSHGSQDRVYRRQGGFILAWNTRLGYVGLERELPDGEDEP